MGGIKHDGGKNRLDLLPIAALMEVGKVYSFGCSKYEDRNWEKGIKYSRLFGALLRHLWGWWRGERNDPETKLHHLTSVVWCGLGLLHYELYHELYAPFDDRPNYKTRQMGLPI